MSAPATATPLRDLQLSLPMQLLQAREAAMAQFRPMLRRHDLTEQQWRVVRVLASEPSLDATELASRSMLLPPSLSRILQHLQAVGLVIRKADHDDQRRSVLTLTPRGRRKFQAVGPDSEALYSAIEARFGRRKLATLYSLLAELNDALATGEPEPRETN